jgi:hypothetical protein
VHILKHFVKGSEHTKKAHVFNQLSRPHLEDLNVPIHRNEENSRWPSLVQQRRRLIRKDCVVKYWDDDQSRENPHEGEHAFNELVQERVSSASELQHGPHNEEGVGQLTKD